MASWSPSQSAPLTVSYMCQRQSSGPMLPSAAAMPPWAATVCERVGNTLVMQAVFRPASAQPSVARRPDAAGADDDDVVGVVGDRIGLAVDGRLGGAVALDRGRSLPACLQAPKLSFSTANTQVRPTTIAKKEFSISATTLRPSECT